MRIQGLLPVGSVVLLKGGKKRLMIAGIRQTSKANAEKEYDYMGVLYPEGYLSEEYNALFDHEDIATIYFRGFEDLERQEFIKNLEKYYNDNEAEKKAE